nr:M24 family metallopeptidase [Rhodococcus qingshengii]
MSPSRSSRRASRFCIEGALDYAQTQIDTVGSVTETAVYEHYLTLIHDFRRTYAIPFGVEPFFVNLHAADRSLYPGPPTDFAITANSGSVKLDAGLKVTVDGVVLGTSDMARSLVTTDQAREAYEFFLHIVRDEIIGGLVAGRNCQEVHTDAVAAILKNRDRLIELELLDKTVDFASEYNKRNVGHLMGKQESFGIEFKQGHDTALPPRSLGAAEIQWSYGRYSIGAEDMWFIGKDKTYITSK